MKNHRQTTLQYNRAGWKQVMEGLGTRKWSPQSANPPANPSATWLIGSAAAGSASSCLLVC